jgi:mannose-6-phosphate isomerase-like protein (cupin superfamily)
MEFNDDDGSAKLLLKLVKQTFLNDEIICANGGDRVESNNNELGVDGVTFVYGVGGENKKNSSSWILEEWKVSKTERPWGYYRVLHEVSGLKVKELTIEPGESLSMQKHSTRNEYWIVSSGSCIVKSMLENGYALPAKILEVHDDYHIQTNQWHQLINPFAHPCKMVEIQYGESCIEEDIERA